jgi:hypothetical protein
LNEKQTKLLVFVFGVVFIASMILLAARFPEPTDFQYLVFRVVLALAAAGVATLLPGLLDLHMGIKTENYLRAGSALAVFVLVYMQSPASLVANPKSQGLSSIETPNLNDTGGSSRDNFTREQVADDSHETQRWPSAPKRKVENPQYTEREHECMYKADADGKLVLQERIAEDIWIPNKDCKNQVFK